MPPSEPALMALSTQLVTTLNYAVVRLTFVAYTAAMRIAYAHNNFERGQFKMTQIYDQTAQKKPTNVSINSDLLAKARQLNINLSATLENSLSDQVRTATREHWLKDNKVAIEATNEFISKNGLFSDSYKII